MAKHIGSLIMLVIVMIMVMAMSNYAGRVKVIKPPDIPAAAVQSLTVEFGLKPRKPLIKTATALTAQELKQHIAGIYYDRIVNEKDAYSVIIKLDSAGLSLFNRHLRPMKKESDFVTLSVNGYPVYSTSYRYNPDDIYPWVERIGTFSGKEVKMIFGVDVGSKR